MTRAWRPWSCRSARQTRPAALTLLVAMSAVAAAQDSVNPAPATAASCEALPDWPPLPVRVQRPDGGGDAVIKRTGDGVYVRAEDGAVFAWPVTCPAGTYQRLPWPAQFDPDSLTLTVTPPAAAYGERTERPATPSPVLPAALLGVQATGSLRGMTAAGLPAEASVSMQAQVQSGDLGVRATLDAGARALLRPTSPDRAALGAHVTLTSAYVTWRRGEQEWQAGLVNAGQPLLGAALTHDPAGALPPSVRVETAQGGPYTLRLGGTVLRQGYLQPGVTVLDDLTLPGGDGTLTVTIDEPGGPRSVAIPYHGAASTGAGTLSYQVAAGVSVPTTLGVGREASSVSGTQAALDARAAYQLSPALRVQGHLSAGPNPAVGASLTTTGPVNGTLSVEASRDRSSGQDTLRGTAGVGAQAAWGTWSGAVGVRQRVDASGAASLGTDLTVAATASGFSVQAGVGTLDGVPQGNLALSGSFQRGNWTVQGQFARDRTQVNVGLTVYAFQDGRVQLTTGMQGGEPQLAARYALDTSAWTEARGWPGLQAAVTARALPVPGAQLDLSGPLNASVAVSSGRDLSGAVLRAAGIAGGPASQVPPSVSVALNGQWGVVAGRGLLVPAGLTRLLIVNVGVPGVRVSAGGQSAWTGPDGRAALSLPAAGQRPDVTVLVEEQTLPISATLGTTQLRVTADPHALALLADFTPHLERSALRRLTGRTFPAGTVARVADREASVSGAGYFALPGEPGDRVNVRWPGGQCEATYAMAEDLPCR